MKKKIGKQVKMSESELLSSVAAKLKGKSLFPEKVAEARKLIRNLKYFPDI